MLLLAIARLLLVVLHPQGIEALAPPQGTLGVYHRSEFAIPNQQPCTTISRPRELPVPGGHHT